MKKGEIKLLLLEMFTIVILLLNIFIKNIFNDYTIVVFLSFMFGISVFFVGYEKDKVLDRKLISKNIFFYSMAFLVLIYGLGLFTGYIKSPYSLTLFNVLKNVFPVILLIIIVELFRYNLCKKGENNKIVIVLSMLIFVLVDVITLIHMYDLNNISKILELITVVIIPSLSKNIMLTDFSCRYGYTPCLIYQLIMNLYAFLLPILPDYGIYLESVIMFLIPIILRAMINLRFGQEEKEGDFRDKHIIKKIFTCICLFIIVFIIALCSNLFSLWIAIIGSGSMTPTINIGDAIIVDKSITKDLSGLAVGDILVFRVEDLIYTHRIVEINENNGMYYISTKGDRKGNVIDLWTVTNDDIIGKVKFKIPYIGYPTVWLNNLLEESKE